MIYRIGDYIRVAKVPKSAVYADRLHHKGIILTSGRARLGRYVYRICFSLPDFDGGFQCTFFETELELVSRPSLEELLTSEHEEVREYGKAVTFWSDHERF